MILNSNKYIGFDSKYHVYSVLKDGYGKPEEINQILKEDSELEKLSLLDIYQEIDKRSDIYRRNVYGLQELDCRIGTRLFDFEYRLYDRQRVSLEMEQMKLQQRLFDERAGYFKDSLRLRELALQKKESIRNEESGLIERMMI